MCLRGRWEGGGGVKGMAGFHFTRTGSAQNLFRNPDLKRRFRVLFTFWPGRSRSAWSGFADSCGLRGTKTVYSKEEN